jgi:hypothetical protein
VAGFAPRRIQKQRPWAIPERGHAFKLTVAHKTVAELNWKCLFYFVALPVPRPAVPSGFPFFPVCV